MKLLKTNIHLLLLLLLASCSGHQPGKTAKLDPGDESGIGGTGILAEESGLGGTGIIGEVTGFGSIFVNGIEVELDNNTRLYMNGTSVEDYDFAIGDVVEIISTNRAGSEFARTLHIRHEVIGPVEQRNLQTGRLKVLGQEVLLNGAELPPLHQYVRVSGFRDQQGRIHARRIEQIQTGTALISGPLQQNADGALYIGEQKLLFKTSAAQLVGQYIRVTGKLHGDGLEVQRYQPDTASITRASQHLYIQGFVRKQSTTQFRIANRLVEASSFKLQRQLAQQTGQLVRLELHRGPQQTGWQLKRIISAASMPRGRLVPPRQQRDRQPETLRPYRPEMPHRPGRHRNYFTP